MFTVTVADVPVTVVPVTVVVAPIAAPEVAVTAKPEPLVITKSPTSGWYYVTMPDGEKFKANGAKAFKALLRKLKSERK